MRVIAGKYGSRPLRSLRGLAVRPTTDRLRETLFNILGPAIEGAVFVDLYAGTGTVGIEAISRGASEVVFVEKHAAAMATIQKNLKSLGIETGRMQVVGIREAGRVVQAPVLPRVAVLPVDVERGIEMLAARRLAPDFVFLDPPYNARQEYEATLEAISDARLLATAGRVIVESRRGGKNAWELPAGIGNLERTRVVEQGDAVLTFYRLALAA